MDNGIRELYIRDYKGIHNLKLSELKKINILTGNNNSGKTSILELLYVTDQTEALKRWLMGTRTIGGYFESVSLFDGFMNLFPANSEEKLISFSYSDFQGVYNTVEADGIVTEEQLSLTQINKINGLMSSASKARIDSDSIYRDVHGVQFRVQKNTLEIANNIIYDFQNRLQRAATKRKSNVIYISPLAQQNYSVYLNGILSNLEYSNQIVELLQIFDSDIVGINAIKTDRLSTSYQIMSKAFGKTIPISSYGDGMKKAIALFGGLVEAKDGILLVDEFETGIHTSAMDRIFRVLLDGAEKYNVQIFLTSHSDEAINRVLKLEHPMHEQMNVYTLYKYNGKNHVRCLDASQALVARDRYGMELR